MREVVELNLEGLRLVGTRHTPPAFAGHQHGPARAAVDLAVLLLNFGFAPRASQGDVAACKADRLAQLGCHVFRFDLPGLGDSEGELADNAVTVVQFIQGGGFARCAAQLAVAVKKRFGVSRLLLAGHCGGAVSAILAADKLHARDIAGLMIYEPDFQTKATPDEDAARANVVHQEVLALVLRNRGMAWVHAGLKALKLRCQSLKNRLAGAAAVNPASPAHGSGPTPEWPPLTNRKVIESWHRVVAKGLPVLVVTAPDPAGKKEQFGYVDCLVAHKPANVTHVKIPATNHSFVEGNGKQAVIETSEQWLRSQFRLAPAVEPRAMQPA